jgi:hypothetical protein
VGHLGGDVDPNAMDALCVLEMSKWILSDLVRIFHQVTTTEATALVNGLIQRNIPLIWQIGNKLRVLNPQMTMKDKTLAVLYHSMDPVPEKTLLDWVEHSNVSVFRQDILRKAHRDKLIEYDEKAATVVISPMGIDYVERSVL